MLIWILHFFLNRNIYIIMDSAYLLDANKNPSLFPKKKALLSS